MESNQRNEKSKQGYYYEQLLTERRTQFLIEENVGGNMSETCAQTIPTGNNKDRSKRSSALYEKRESPRPTKHLRGTAEICT